MREFINFLYKSGYPPFSEADIKDTDGESVLIRAKDDKQGKRTLYFSYTVTDGKAFGTYYSCRTGEHDYWYEKSSKEWTPEEKENYKKLCEEKKKKAEADRNEKYDRVSVECKAIYASLPTAFTHPYADRKGILIPNKVKQDGDSIVIPAIDISGTIWTIQSISAEGDKLFHYGGKKSGTFFPIGYKKSGDNSIIYFCEGFATGCTIHQAINKPTIICWDAGNIMSVVSQFRGQFPDSELVIAADNDQWTLSSPRDKSVKEIIPSDVAGDDDRWEVWRRNGLTYNTGLDKAGQAAAKYRARVIFPDIPSNDIDKRTDFNDMGIDFTRESLSGVGVILSPSPESAPEVVEHSPPSLYAPASGDEILDNHYEPEDGMFSFEKPMEVVKNRSDGNPLWFTDFIWDREPSEKLNSIYAIKGLHDGKSLHNLITFIRGYYSGLFVLNEFSDEIIVRVHPPWLAANEEFRVHTLTDSDVINMSAHVENFGFKVGKEKVRDAIVSISEKDRIHPVKQYMRSLQWDGVNRLSTWLRDYAGATVQDEKYLSAIGTKWLLAGVARTFQAGCKFDHMLVLEGKTDIGKSALLRELATFGDIEEAYFTDAVSMKDFDRPFAAMLWQGNLILEFAELDGMDKASINTVKAWITRQEDVYQPKFSNDKKHRPRQFILAGTTNEDVWMVDTTGNKRFWPVHCTFTNIPALKEVKEQLWAEAMHLYESGERWWLSDDDPVYQLAKSEQSLRMVGDSWQDILQVKFRDCKWVTMQDAYEHLGIPITQRDRGTDARIRGIMAALKFEWKISYANTKHHSRVWVRE